MIYNNDEPFHNDSFYGEPDFSYVNYTGSPYNKDFTGYVFDNNNDDNDNNDNNSSSFSDDEI
jgi:hypothetical protein